MILQGTCSMTRVVLLPSPPPPQLFKKDLYTPVEHNYCEWMNFWSITLEVPSTRQDKRSSKNCYNALEYDLTYLDYDAIFLPKCCVDRSWEERPHPTL